MYKAHFFVKSLVAVLKYNDTVLLLTHTSSMPYTYPRSPQILAATKLKLFTSKLTSHNP